MAATSIGDVAATVVSQSTFSLDGSDPLINYKVNGLVSGQPAIIQRIGTPLTASPQAQLNTPPPNSAPGVAPAVATVTIAPASTPTVVPPFTSATYASSVASSGVSPEILVIAVVLILLIFFL